MRIILRVRGRIGDVTKAFVEGRLETDERWVELPTTKNITMKDMDRGRGCRRHERDLTFDGA